MVLRAPAPRLGEKQTHNEFFLDQPSHVGSGVKELSVPDLKLSSSITDANSGTVASKGGNAKLEMWTQLQIAIIPIPPNAVIK